MNHLTWGDIRWRESPDIKAWHEVTFILSPRIVQDILFKTQFKLILNFDSSKLPWNLKPTNLLANTINADLCIFHICVMMWHTYQRWNVKRIPRHPSYCLSATSTLIFGPNPNLWMTYLVRQTKLIPHYFQRSPAYSVIYSNKQIPMIINY